MQSLFMGLIVRGLFPNFSDVTPGHKQKELINVNDNG